MKVLIIEDNQDIVAGINDYLQALNYEVDAAGDGATGLHLALTKDYDAIILDLGLPDIDGIDLCRRLRQDARRILPVLMLTARDSLENKLEGFKSGADDYLVKPFSLKELAARIKTLTKHLNEIPTLQSLIEEFSIDVETHEVNHAGKHNDYYPALFKLIMYLMQNPHRVVKREELEYAVWQDNLPDSDALRTYLTELNQVVDKPI